MKGESVDNGIELRELLDTKSLNIHYSGGIVIDWAQQADFFLAASGLFSIVVGIIGIWDGIAESHNRSLRRGGVDSYATNSTQLQHAILHEYTGTSDLLPLVLFGAVTAFAWTCTGRAVFRMNSIEALPHIANPRGITQQQLSNIFELRTPTMPWIRWRVKLWKSTLFALANILLYAGAGISYRAAFSTRSQYLTAPILPTTEVTPLLGCPRSMSRLEKFTSLVVGYRETFNGYSSFWSIEDPVPLESGDWVIAYGWHQYRLLESEVKTIQKASITGPFIVHVIQISNTLSSSRNDTFKLARHPTCGNLPQFCTAGLCVWFGLWARNFTVETRFVAGLVYADDNDLETEIARIKCPIKLNEYVYDEIVKNNQPRGNQTDFFLQETMALALSYLHANLSLIEDQTLLRDMGFLGIEGMKCSKTGGYKGEMSFEIRSNFWPVYQFLACLLVMTWGSLLLFAAWPFKTYLVRGTLNQYMSFGSDVGPEDMLGTSSGLCGSGSDARWRFALRTENGCGKMAMENAQELSDASREAEDRNPKLRFGTKWI